MTHPILAAVGDIAEVLKGVADVNPTFMATDDKATAMRDLVALESRVVELRLRVMAGADDVAESTAARDSAGWIAAQARVRPEDARADLTLAHALDRQWGVLAAGVREGRVNVPQARVISRCLADLPKDVPTDVVQRAEVALVDFAAKFAPKQLGMLGRRILETVAPDMVDEAEGKKLAAAEAAARRSTRFSMRRMGDGTTQLSGRIPDASATRLATYLESFANPRREQSTTKHDTTGADPVDPLPYPRRLGEALCSLLECFDPASLPVHGGDATTVIVTIDLKSLRNELGVAGLLGTGTIPGDTEEAGLGKAITAAQARRLACSARIIPAVLGGDSEILDLGRARRLFSPAQQRALLLRDGTCRAEGCDIPGTWAEAHHWVPWSQGGESDLDNGVLLCSHHHHRIHDRAYQADRLPNGDVRFARRT